MRDRLKVRNPNQVITGFVLLTIGFTVATDPFGILSGTLRWIGSLFDGMSQMFDGFLSWIRETFPYVISHPVPVGLGLIAIVVGLLMVIGRNFDWNEWERKDRERERRRRGGY